MARPYPMVYGRTDKRIKRLKEQLLQALDERNNYRNKCQDLKALLDKYHDHVCSSAPLTWASTPAGKYSENAYEWEKEWQVLKEEVEKVLNG